MKNNRKAYIHKTSKIFILILLMLFLGSALLFSDTILIKNGRYLDVRSGNYIDFNWMLIQQGQIKAIGDERPLIQNTEQDQIIEIDATGYYIIPGFFNSHVHIGFAPLLDRWARAGVTTLIDFAIPIETGKSLADKTCMNYYYFELLRSVPYQISASDLYYAGPILTVEGGYRSDFIAGFVIETPEQASQVVRELIQEQGATFIKVAVTNYRGYKRISAEILKSICDTAHKLGKKVAAYIDTPGDAVFAVENGVDILAHAPVRDFFEEQLEYLIEKDIPMIPTLSVSHGINRVLREQEKAITAMTQGMTWACEQYYEAGGTILLGNDFGNPWMEAGIPWQEIKLLKAVGLSNIEIIRSATIIPAETFNLTNTGEIAIGKEADILLLKENPSENLDALGDIIIVINNGSIIRDERNTDLYLEIDIGYSSYFTSKEALIGTMTPQISAYPNTLTLNFAPEYADIDGSFAMGIMTRLSTPKEQQSLEIKSDYILNHTNAYIEGKIIHSFTPTLSIGVQSSIIPNVRWSTGIHLWRSPLPIFWPGSKDWLALDLYGNYEEYYSSLSNQPDFDSCRLFTLGSNLNIYFTDFLPLWIDKCNLSVQLEGGMQFDSEYSYIRDKNSLRIDLFNFTLSLWTGAVWGLYPGQKGLDLSDLNIVEFGKYRNNTLLATRLDYFLSIFSFFYIYRFGINPFIEAGKTSESVESLFQGENWTVDFGIGLKLDMGWGAFKFGFCKQILDPWEWEHIRFYIYFNN